MNNLLRLTSRVCISEIFSVVFYRPKSTIYALSSGYGKCGVAVIRVSGPQASGSLIKIAGMKKLPSPRQAILRKLRDPKTKEIIDHGIVIWFPEPKSFTGEDVCELHVHGGIAVIISLLEALDKLSDYRPADPGEFTKRAFYAGKLDLLEVEGLGDLIQAETEAQRKQALFQMEGILSKLYMDWKQTLLKCVAHVEAYIDFSEDENIEEDILQKNEIIVQRLISDLKEHLADGRRGERLRDGVRAVIIGEPNVGKSSLLNLLCHKPAAIVSSIPGTTRDVLERPLNIEGFPILLSDTAGLRADTDDPIELEGVKRAHECVAEADLILLVADAEVFNKQILLGVSFEKLVQSYMDRLLLTDILLKKEGPGKNLQDNLSDEILNQVPKPKYSSKTPLKSNCLLILNKKDMITDDSHIELLKKENPNLCIVSCKTNDGISHLIDILRKELSNLCANPTRENPSLTQSRHRHHLQNCLLYLEDYIVLYEESHKSDDCDVVLMVQKLRQAMHSLGKITGYVSTEELLDVIFSDFCIGK